MVVKIGLVAPFEGRFRYIGYDAIYAARLAVREINLDGGVGSLRLELVAYDDRGTVEMGTRVAHNLVVDPDVLAVLGHYRSETSAAASPIYAEAGLPLIALGGWASSASEPYQLMPGYDRVARGMVAVALDENAQSATILGDGAALDGALRRAAGEGSLAITVTNPDVAFTTSSPVEAAEQLATLRETGWIGGMIGTGDLAAPAFGLAGRSIVPGVESVTPGVQFVTPGVQFVTPGVEFVTPYPFPRDVNGTDAWVAAYRAMGPHVPDPGPYALPTYDAVRLIADALSVVLNETSVPDRGTLKDALGEVRHLGVLGDIAFDAHGMWEPAHLYRYRWDADGPQLLAVLP